MEHCVHKIRGEYLDDEKHRNVEQGRCCYCNTAMFVYESRTDHGQFAPNLITQNPKWTKPCPKR